MPKLLPSSQKLKSKNYSIIPSPYGEERCAKKAKKLNNQGEGNKAFLKRVEIKNI